MARDHILELLRDGQVLQHCIIRSRAHRKEMMTRWRHMYGVKFALMQTTEYLLPKQYVKIKPGRPTTIKLYE